MPAEGENSIWVLNLCQYKVGGYNDFQGNARDLGNNIQLFQEWFGRRPIGTITSTEVVAPDYNAD